MTEPSSEALVYTVDHYEATFTVIPNAAGDYRNLDVTLFIRYQVSQGEKSDGFKFVGTLPIQDVAVTDGKAHPLSFQVAQYDETKITWQFPTVRRGSQEVIVHFTILGAVQQSGTESSVNLIWVKNWRVPVREAIYRLVLPTTQAPAQWSATPTGAELITWQEHPTIEVRQSPLADLPFTVNFTLLHPTAERDGFGVQSNL